MIKEQERHILLQYLCDNQRTVTLLIKERDLRARFSSVGQDVLEFELFSEAPSFDLEESSCVCLFAVRDRTHAFVVTARQVLLQKDRLPRLVASIPGKIFMSESRKSFRVPLDSDTPLSVQIRGYGPAQPRNIGAGGILVEFDTEEIDLPVGSQVAVELALESKEILLKAEVQRRQGRRMALSFKQVVGGEPAPPPILVEMIEHLEEVWTRTRFRELRL